MSMKTYCPLLINKTLKYPTPSAAARRHFLRAGAAVAGLSALAPGLSSLATPSSQQQLLLVPPAHHLSWLQRGADFFSRLVGDLSGHNLQFAIQSRAPRECFQQVVDGSAHACFAYLRDWQAEPYARNFFAGLPGGLNTPGVIGWLYEGGGLSLWRSVCEPLGVVPMLVGSSGMSLAGCFQSPVRSGDEIKGLKMRLLGPHARRVWEQAGGIAVSVGEAELVAALHEQKIAAAEPLSPLLEDMQDLIAAAPYCYYPSWQSPATTVVCLYNRQAYDNHSDDQRAILIAAARSTAEKMERILTAENAAYMRKLQMQGAKFERLPASLLTKLLRLAQSVVAEMSHGDEWLTQVGDSYIDFQNQLLHLHRVTESAYFQKMMLTESG